MNRTTLAPPLGFAPAVAIAQPALTQPLSSNDVSWLFPPPHSAADMATLIAVNDITVPNAQDPTKRDPVWSDAVFQQFLSNALGPMGQVDGATDRITLPDSVKAKTAWFVAGIRFDPGAPGLFADTIAQFGQSPEIRLIIQPVIPNGPGAPLIP